jgi:hypothetical protein
VKAKLAIVLGVALTFLSPLIWSTPADAANWTPRPGQSWQWMLSSVPTPTQLAAAPDITAWDVDGFDTSAQRVADIHARGAGAVCYISAGSWENWRPDAGAFPASVKGRKLDGWAGERWLDIRMRAVLQPIMTSRIQMCKDKGFDAVEPDNVDGYTNNTGLGLTSADQLAYNGMIAGTAHSLGLYVALKNDVDQVRTLEPYFDFALNEECYAYNECGAYTAFRSKGKAVWIVEYTTPTTSFCPKAIASGFDAMKKKLSLGAYRVGC